MYCLCVLALAGLLGVFLSAHTGWLALVNLARVVRRDDGRHERLLDTCASQGRFGCGKPKPEGIVLALLLRDP